jgi:hypothetical protein
LAFPALSLAALQRTQGAKISIRCGGFTVVNDEREELQALVWWEKKRHHRLMSAHDCRDPDHPGCERCEDDEEDDE